jgi:putative CocE/NonD family hydrolase
MGPWDHAGTRTPNVDVGGVKFAKASLHDLNQLHKEWYDWTMKDGDSPAFLEKRVTYYVAGAEAWKYCDSLEAIPTTPLLLYLNAPSEGGKDIFHSGKLDRKKPNQAPPATYVYDPLDLRPAEGEREIEKTYLTDQRQAMKLAGDGLVYHGEPLASEVEIVGQPKFTAWIRLDVPDTDFWVKLYVIQPDGKSVLLAEDILRARYRESLRQEKLVKRGEINRYEFASFPWFARRLEKGSRLRLVFTSPNSIYWEKNYNSGGEVAQETKMDARTAHITLLQDDDHPSCLELPVITSKR